MAEKHKCGDERKPVEAKCNLCDPFLISSERVECLVCLTRFGECEKLRLAYSTPAIPNVV